MKSKLITIAVMTALYAGSVHSFENNLMFRIPTSNKLSNWTNSSPIYHPWVNEGQHYNCASWSPTPDSIDFGTSFTQYRDCSQNQQREVEIREMDTFSGIVKTVSKRQEDRTVNETESQGAVGSYRNWVLFDSTYTEWSDFGNSYDYLAWTPAPSNQASDFTQNRGYKMNQERLEQKREFDTVTGDIRDTGEPVRHEQADARTESRAVNVSFTAWTDTMRDGYTDWTPTSYNETSDFTQTREFGQHQIRDRVYAHSGDELGRFNETRVVSPVFENRSVSVTSTPWADTNRSNYSAWSPAPTSETSSFTQSRTYTQNQERTWSYQTGGTFLSSRVEPRGVDNQPESRTITVAWSEWIDSGIAYSCGVWSPSVSTVAWGQLFTQTRSCSQDQVKNRVYSSGESYQESKTISVTQSQDVTGTSDYVVSHTYGTWSGWSNSGGIYGCSAWSPDTSTVCSGSGFTQTRSCSQDQTRSRSVTALWASGSTSSAGTDYDSQTISAGQSQGATGTQSCWVAASSTYTSWTTYNTNWGTWSPQATTQTSGFTQSRKNTLYQEQYEQAREYNPGTSKYRNVGSPIRYTRTTTDNESRSVGVYWTSWVQVGTPQTQCEADWWPATSEVASGTSFTQVQYCWLHYYRERHYTSTEAYEEWKSEQKPYYKSAIGTKSP